MCFGLFVCYWVPRQIKLSYYDLQMKVDIAERLMELKEGEYPTVNFFRISCKDTRKNCISVIVHLLEVAISPVLTFPLYF